MLNPKTSIRELCYFVTIDDVLPHTNADRLEIAVVGGWHCVVGKGEFRKGDIGVYFEIDSLLPNSEPFSSMEFLASKKFKIKTQKIRGELSQGFVIHPSIFKGTEFGDLSDVTEYNDDNRFLTEKLNVKYYDPSDNERKSNSSNKVKVDKYKRMMNRYPNLCKYSLFRVLMKNWLMKRIIFLFLGRKHDAQKANWPSYVKKTDEERIQNMPWILKNKDPWIVTEKVDGTSLTVTWKPEGDNEGLFICSRNLAFFETDDNLYTKLAKARKIPEALKEICKEYKLDWVTFQGEIYGRFVQKNEYSLPYNDIVGFNLIFSDIGRLNSVVARNIMAKYDVRWVPILEINYTLPDTIEELMEYVDSEKSVLANVIREGLVFRSPDGSKSFKAVSNKYLLKYHPD